jgi:hypothetical protein
MSHDRNGVELKVGYTKLLLALVLLAAPLLGGCQLFKPNTEPLERGVTMLVSEVIKPAIAKAGDELSARTAQLQGQGSLINPGYVVEGFASAGPATTFKFSIRAEGVSANLAGAGQADAGQPGAVPPPAVRKPTETPSTTPGG